MINCQTKGSLLVRWTEKKRKEILGQITPAGDNYEELLNI